LRRASLVELFGKPDDELLAELRRDYRNAKLEPADRVMLDFAVKLTLTPYKHTQEDVEKLRAVGFDDVGILQITLIAAFFNYINRVADALGVGKSGGEGAQ
jgi:uncharacterized peroxidase-related enzyme